MTFWMVVFVAGHDFLMVTIEPSLIHPPAAALDLGPVSTLVIEWVPLKPELGVSCFWRLLFFEGWPRRSPFSRAEDPPIAFIRELRKQLRIGLVLLGEGQSAISYRAGVARGHLKSQRNRTRISFVPTEAARSAPSHAPGLTGRCPGETNIAGLSRGYSL